MEVTLQSVPEPTTSLQHGDEALDALLLYIDVLSALLFADRPRPCRPHERAA